MMSRYRDVVMSRSTKSSGYRRCSAPVRRTIKSAFSANPDCDRSSAAASQLGSPVKGKRHVGGMALSGLSYHESSMVGDHIPQGGKLLSKSPELRASCKVPRAAGPAGAECP